MYLELKNVRYAYDKQIVLNDINFSIEKGEITGLIGANGAGKTTTILNLTKKITPQSGEILVNGINLQNSTSQLALRPQAETKNGKVKWVTSAVSTIITKKSTCS